MKSYSFELVQRKSGSGALGKVIGLAALGVGIYYGYKKLTDETKQQEFSNGQQGGTFDVEAHEGEDFAARILKAAKRVVK